MNKELSSKITNANVLFTIFVVCLHARPSNLGVYHIVGTIADAAVPNFFVISSYLYFSSFCWEETCKSYFSKIKKRICSLLIPYLIFCAIGFLVITVKHLFKHEQLPYDIYSFQSIIRYWILGKGNPPLWYLTSLFEFVLFAPIIGYLVKLTKYSFFLKPLSAIACNALNYSNILFWMPVLLLGAYCYYWERVVSAFFLKFGNFLMVAVIMLLILFCCYFYGLDNRNIWQYYVYRMIVPVIFIVVYSKIIILPSSIVDNLKQYALFIYCVHYILLQLISPILKNISPFIGYAFKVIATIVIAYSIGVLLKIYFPRLWNILVGGR